MSEPISNIGVRRRTPPDPGGRYSSRPCEFFLDQYVKLAFPYGCGNHFEYMWVKVVDTSEEPGAELVGTLDNDPIYVADYKCGGGVGFNRTEIVELLGEQNKNSAH